MAEFYYLDTYKNRAGKCGISRKAFETIATIASNNLQNVKIKDLVQDNIIAKLNSIFSLVRPVHASFRKDGRVDFVIDTVVNPKITQIAALCTRIQEEVSNVVSMMCETLSFSVEIHVSKEKVRPLKATKEHK
ncbi:MAG: hypothetical protein MJ228_01885 [Bacilli bacterium]|nr:hypothetical protein [Bacilli bacterium]